MILELTCLGLAVVAVIGWGTVAYMSQEHDELKALNLVLKKSLCNRYSDCCSFSVENWTLRGDMQLLEDENEKLCWDNVDANAFNHDAMQREVGLRRQIRGLEDELLAVQNECFRRDLIQMQGGKAFLAPWVVNHVNNPHTS